MNILSQNTSEAAMNEIHHHETYEIKDNLGRQILHKFNGMKNLKLMEHHQNLTQFIR